VRVFSFFSLCFTPKFPNNKHLLSTWLCVQNCRQGAPGWLKQLTIDFSSGHDFRITRLSPCLALCQAWSLLKILSLPFLLLLPLEHMNSLSPKKKKKERKGTCISLKLPLYSQCFKQKASSLQIWDGVLMHKFILYFF